MKTDIGEYIVGAYLKVIEGCSFIDYNVRPPGGGLEGLNEIDVLGFDLEKRAIYLCEVTTHILGLNYGSHTETIQKINDKYLRLKEYAKKNLKVFTKFNYMFWSPVISKGYLTNELEKIQGLKVIINEKYTEKIDMLRKKAKRFTQDFGNPFFRVLQILEKLK